MIFCHIETHWCSSGVVDPFRSPETLDFTGFLETFTSIAVAQEKYFYHILKSSWFALVFPALPQFAKYVAAAEIVKAITE